MKIRAIDISKLALYLIFFNYYCFYILVGSFIPMGTYLFLAVAIIGVLATVSEEPLKFGFDIKCWIIYTIYSAITVVVAYSPDYAIDGLIKFIQRLVVIILITYICQYEKSIMFAIRLLAVTAVACAMSSLLMMNDFTQKLTMSSGASVSTNDIGSIMAFGCFAVLFAFGTGENNKLYKTAFKLIYIAGAFTVIAVAGSRKSIIAILIMFAIMFVFCWNDYLNKMTNLQFVGILIVGVIAIYWVMNSFLSSFEDTNLYVRMYGRGAERTAQSDAGRMKLYMNALQDFVNNFFLGLGFNNYTFMHGNYTHSTYVEPLACSGIFGLLYLIPYAHILVNQIKLSFSKEEIYANTNRVFQKQMLAFFIAFLFVGIGIPYMYKDIPCIILAMYIAWQSICMSEPVIKGKLIGDGYGKFSNKSIASNK